MTYINARSTQRFFAYFIDALLLGVIVSFLVRLIPAYNNSMRIFQEYYKLYLEEGNIIPDAEELSYIFKHLVKAYGIMMLFEIPICILYFIVLPYFWEKQTLGRLLLHVKVVSMDGNKPKLKSLILREFVGGILILRILSTSIILPIIYWYMSATIGRTLSDLIGGTRLVEDKMIYTDHPEEPESFKDDKDYVDAVFRDVQEEPTGEPKDSKEEDTEYKVF
ncbi:MAG: RDD family protein [Anaeroplasmataceae bacterium]|nr:RDD family protein [Anaeroplasmataceae bacterium]